MSWKLFDIGKPLANYYAESLEASYRAAMEYLSAQYHNYPSALREVSSHEMEHYAMNSPGNIQANFYHSGHNWTYDSSGNITHCDNVPIGRCVF